MEKTNVLDFGANPASPEQIFEKYGDMVYRLAYIRMKNPHDAADIMQDVFVRYMRHQNGIKSEEHRKAWLIRATINCAKSLLTSAWRKRTTALTPADDESAEMISDDGIVYSAVMGLPEKYRVAVHLYYYEDYSTAEIAAATGAKEATVRSDLFRARKLLKEALKEEIDDV